MRQLQSGVVPAGAHGARTVTIDGDRATNGSRQNSTEMQNDKFNYQSGVSNSACRTLNTCGKGRAVGEIVWHQFAVPLAFVD